MMNVFFYRLIRIFVTIFYKKIPQKLGLPVPPRPTTSVLCVNKGKILVINISYKKGLTLPGGGTRIGESFEKAAKRELFEETGLTGYDLKYFASFGSNNEYPASNVVFTAKVKGKLKNSIEGRPLWADPKIIVKELVYSDNRQAVGEWLKHHG